MSEFAEPQDRTFTHAGVKWRVREVSAKPGKLAGFLAIAILESEQGRRYAPIGMQLLQHLSNPDLVELLERSKPVPLWKQITFPADPKPRPRRSLYQGRWE